MWGAGKLYINSCFRIIELNFAVSIICTRNSSDVVVPCWRYTYESFKVSMSEFSIRWMEGVRVTHLSVTYLSMEGVRFRAGVYSFKKHVIVNKITTVVIFSMWRKYVSGFKMVGGYLPQKLMKVYFILNYLKGISDLTFGYQWEQMNW